MHGTCLYEDYSDTATTEDCGCLYVLASCVGNVPIQWSLILESETKNNVCKLAKVCCTVD